MKDFSIPMALVDYIPVIFFGIAAVLLQRGLYNKMSKGAFALFAAGTIDIFCAGALKATYKLLYAAGVCDFQALSDVFFPLQSIGFLLAGIGIVAMLCCRQEKTATLNAAVAPVLFKGTFVFVAAMVAGAIGIDVGLAMIAVKMKKKGAAVLFVISLLLTLSMGYLSSKDFTQASMNWITQFVNIAGQGALLLGAVMLRKAGLKDFELKRSK